MSLFFNAGTDMNGICFNCLNKNTELCIKCMKLSAKPSNGKLLKLDNTVKLDPIFKDLYDKIAEDTALALELDGDGQP